MQIEFVRVQSLPRISRWFSSAKTWKCSGTRVQVQENGQLNAHSEIRPRLQGAAGARQLSSLQHCSNSFSSSPTRAALGAALATPSSALPFFCEPFNSVADCVTCIRWLKPSYEWERLFACGWMKWKGKPKTFICHVISSYVNMLPTFFLLSQMASSMNI